MEQDHLSTTHLWFEQKVSIKGRPFLHRRCKVCERDFARALVDRKWRAVHVGVLSLDFLDDATTQRWVSEDCPGRPLPGEANSERVQRGEKGHASSNPEVDSSREPRA
ncbi:MAG: hypothetical protein JO232_06485 [Verrucomicrobia bacterium]|nr:hypothetical protein [Verrucomicrobiota bacterium]